MKALNRLKVFAKQDKEEQEPEWWTSMSPEQQTKYLEDHPNSKKAKEAKEEQETQKNETIPATPSKKLEPVLNYRPDVDADSDGDGVTDAARVGVKGDQVPVPPAIPRLPGLTEEESKVQEAFASDFEKNQKAMTDDFLGIVLDGKKPPTFGTDDAKILSAAWAGPPGEDRSKRRATMNLALHQTANAIAKRAFVKHLKTLKKGDKILVTVGGCGAGKGYSLGNVDAAKKVADSCQAVWDSAGDQNATENPWIQKEAEKLGLKVAYVFVNANPEVSWADPNRGVIKRANNPEDGRMVDAMVFADSYAIGARNHAAFAEANKDNKNAEFIYIDSDGKPPTQVDKMPESALKWDRHKLSNFALKALKDADTTDAIRNGGSQGTRIWGSPKEESSFISFKRKAPVIAAKRAKQKDKYSWEQYEKDENEHQRRLSQDKRAGKYGKTQKAPNSKLSKGDQDGD